MPDDNNNNNTFATGALPPENVAWQVGKTPGSIRFVNDAEVYIPQFESRIDVLESGLKLCRVRGDSFLGDFVEEVHRYINYLKVCVVVLREIVEAVKKGEMQIGLYTSINDILNEKVRL